VDLDTVEPFTDEYRLLPLRFRTYVDQQHLSRQVRIRQNTYYRDVVKEVDPTEDLEPDETLVEEYVTEFMRNRKLKGDGPPSVERFEQYVELAKKKAIKKEKARLSGRLRKRDDNNLTFEEQWRRRDQYGIPFEMKVT
jgi:hypothetical protein